MDSDNIMNSVLAFADGVHQQIGPAQIILYGSYAKGNARDDSDIDIAVIVDGLQGDYLDMSASLFKLRRHIDDRIEPVLIDSGDTSGFLRDILDTGKVILGS